MSLSAAKGGSAYGRHRVCAHEALFQVPKAIGEKFGLVVIDEGFWQDGLTTTSRLVISSLAADREPAVRSLRFRLPVGLRRLFLRADQLAVEAELSFHCGQRLRCFLTDHRRELPPNRYITDAVYPVNPDPFHNGPYAQAREPPLYCHTGGNTLHAC